MIISYNPYTMSNEEIARELIKADSWGDVSELVDYLVEVGEVSGDPDTLEGELEEWAEAHRGEEIITDDDNLVDGFLETLREGDHAPFNRVKAFCSRYLKKCGYTSWRGEAVLSTIVNLVTEITPVNALQFYEGIASLLRFTSLMVEDGGKEITIEGQDGDLYMDAMNEVLEVSSMLVLGMDAPLLSWYERTEGYTRVLMVDLTWDEAFTSLCDVMHMCFTYTTKYLFDNPDGYGGSVFETWSLNRKMSGLYCSSMGGETSTARVRQLVKAEINARAGEMVKAIIDSDSAKVKE